MSKKESTEIFYMMMSCFVWYSTRYQKIPDNIQAFFVILDLAYAPKTQQTLNVTLLIPSLSHSVKYLF